jgi:catechol-2,3-dioxygenase
MQFERTVQHDYDLHIALEVEPPVLAEMMAKGKSLGIETRGISEHGFVRSIYFRDPNGYVIELTAKTPEHVSIPPVETRLEPDLVCVWYRST